MDKKGFTHEKNQVEGRLSLNENFTIELEIKENEILICPRCQKGKFIVGNKVFGCEDYKLDVKQLSLLKCTAKLTKLKSISW